MTEIIEAALMLMCCVSLAWQTKRINDLENKVSDLEEKVTIDQMIYKGTLKDALR